MDFQYFCFVSIFASFFILSNKNAKIHKNRTQSTLFICFFITLYGFYGILLYWSWKPHVLPFFWYLTFDLLTISHKMAIISVTLSVEKCCMHNNFKQHVYIQALMQVADSFKSYTLQLHTACRLSEHGACRYILHACRHSFMSNTYDRSPWSVVCRYTY